MRNFARFLQRWRERLTDGVTTSSLYVAEITDTFLSYSAADTGAQAASWLTIGAGMLTTIGAFLPAAGAASWGDESPVQDPRFTDFSKLEANLGRMKQATVAGITNYFNEMLVNTPPDGDSGKGTQLARMLEGGAFADQDFATGESFPSVDLMVELIQASIISEAWNSGSVAIVKWSRDHPLSSDYFNPCFGGERYGLDSHIACQMDKNWVIVGLTAPVWSIGPPVRSDPRLPQAYRVQGRMITEEQSLSEYNHVAGWPDVGQTEETLKKYGLNHDRVLRAAMRTQERANMFMPRGLKGLTGLFTGLAEDPGQNAKKLLEQLIYFNVPVCDLDLVADQYESDKCIKRGGADGWKARCVMDLVSRNCMKLSLGGDEWPYRYSSHSATS